MSSENELVSAALPGYDVGEPLGRGGCGLVFSGHHRQLGRPVAIKEIPSQFSADPVVKRRFLAEARLLASIDHPHVVPVYDFVEHADLCLLVMELLPGGTVWTRFTSEGFDAPSAAAVALACAAGLQAAHDRGILHRDIKPANLMFAATGSLKVTDFGIAKVIGGNETLATRTSVVIGTPSYIAPEQARGEPLTPATDVYATATMLYELLAGELPFPRGTDSMATLFKHAYEAPTPLSERAPTVPEPIAEVVMRGLATNPAMRYATAEDFGVALAQACTESWGPGWLSGPGISVIGADTIASAASGGAEPSTPPTSRSESSTSSFAATRGVGRTSTTMVRPVITSEDAGPRLADIARDELVPIQAVIKLRPARGPLIAAALLALLVMVIAFIAPGTPSSDGTVPPGSVTVAGVDPTTGTPVNLDLSIPVTVTSNGAIPADAVRIELQVLGTTVGQQTAPLVESGPTFAATLPSLVNRYLVAGRFTGRITLLSGGTTVAFWRFPVQTTQSATTTAVAVGNVLLLLFGIAYLESNARSLRHGRSRIGAGLGLAGASGVLAIAIVGLLWVLAGRQPTLATLVTCVVLGVLAGGAGAVGAWRSGRIRRYRRAQRMAPQG
ncbi:serine/threonine-protein kinase [Nocardia nepalensis]|uniref:serine/threonine-protein kinase n=1 Tax=Nocardia nepalensis TaxID=3375448 RepID=UPI003B674F5F